MSKYVGMALIGVAVLFGILLIPLALAFAVMGGGGGGEEASGSSEEYSGDCSADGLAFGLPTSSQEDREAVFGEANSADAQQDTTFMGKSLQVHKKVKPCLEAVERELKQRNMDDYEIRSIGGYSERPGEPLYFFHMYGAAIDINPDTNPFCYCDTHDIPDEWAEVFEKHGFFWGGNFRTKKDWMHFEWHGEAP